MIDIHNHLLIGIDDGPETDLEALDLLKQAVGQGITEIILTPHHYNHQYHTPRNVVMNRMEHLKGLIGAAGLTLNIYSGHEARLDSELIKDLKSKDTMTLNDSRYILVELSDADIPKNIEDMTFELQMEGFVPIIAHPERHTLFIDKKLLLHNLIEKGALVQVTAGTVCGNEGKVLKHKVLEMIEDYFVHFIASDAHHRERRPFMLRDAYQEIENNLGKNYVELLKNNAYSVLHNEEIMINAPRLDVKNEKNRDGFFRYFRGK